MGGHGSRACWPVDSPNGDNHLLGGQFRPEVVPVVAQLLARDLATGLPLDGDREGRPAGPVAVGDVLEVPEGRTAPEGERLSLRLGHRVEELEQLHGR